MDTSYLIGSLIIAAFLGLIPGYIAKNKGYSFGLWWFYGWMLFIIALIHSLCLKDKNPQPYNNFNNNPQAYNPNQYQAPYQAPYTAVPVNNTQNVNVPEILKKYKQLLDDGVITQEEFEEKKKQLLSLGTY